MADDPVINPFGLLPNMSRDEIYTLPLKHFTGRITLVDTLEAFDQVYENLRYYNVLGFDTETKPSFKKGTHNKVSLVQLANHDMAVLIRVNKIGIPDGLLEILSNKRKIKIGVAIKDDLAGLNKLRPFKPEGFVELQNYVKDFGILANGLRELTAILLGFRISKSQQVTNWDADVLSESQLIYAATDAWVGYQIYARLNSLKTI
jgi:ribonuclease D